MRIALVQTGSWGDNINSTLMFKPLKNKWPGATLDVHTSTYYASAFRSNPYIDNIIEYPADCKQAALHLHYVITPQLTQYDMVFAPHPMLNPDKWNSLRHPEGGDNLIYAWVRALEHADVPYELPLTTILQLSPDEMARVDQFCAGVPMSGRRNVLMEVHGESGQTFWHPGWTDTTVRHLLDGNTNVFLSRASDGQDINDLKAIGAVWFVGHLSIRECAELYNRCQVFFSVSSGLSNACNTNWCRQDVTWIETTNSPVVSSAPIRSANKIFWRTDDIGAFINMLREHGI